MNRRRLPVRRWQPAGRQALPGLLQPRLAADAQLAAQPGRPRSKKRRRRRPVHPAPSSTGGPAAPTPSGRAIRGPGSSATCSRCMATCAPTTPKAPRALPIAALRPQPQPAHPRGHRRTGLPGPLPVHRRDPRRARLQRADQRLRDPPHSAHRWGAGCRLPTSQFTNLDSPVELRGIEYQLGHGPGAAASCCSATPSSTAG